MATVRTVSRVVAKPFGFIRLAQNVLQGAQHRSVTCATISSFQTQVPLRTLRNPPFQTAGIIPGTTFRTGSIFPWQPIRNASANKEPEPIPVVTYDYVKKLVDTSDSPNIVDVREPSERDEAVIPMTVNIPLQSVPEAFSLPPKALNGRYGLNINSYDDEIIFHCRSGVRSENAATMARNAGYRNVKNFKGSMLEWTEKNPKRPL